jgi:hypothetical protein
MAIRTSTATLYLLQDEATDSTIFIQVLCPDDEYVGNGRVGDPGLAAAEDVMAVNLLSSGFHTSWIRAMIGFSKTKATNKLTTG